MTLIRNKQHLTQWQTAPHCIASSQAGQALVETALVLPLCVALMLGAVEVARIAYAGIEIANAARAGVAFAAQNRADAASSNAYITQAATQEAPNVSSVSATTSQYCVCSDGTGGATCSSFNAAACAAPKQIEDEVTVTVTGKINTLFGVPGIASTLTLTNSATMWVEQQ